MFIEKQIEGFIFKGKAYVYPFVCFKKGLTTNYIIA